VDEVLLRVHPERFFVIARHRFSQSHGLGNSL
jgi:hypothetical protein